MEVTQAEFARMAGISRAAISSKVKHGTLILNSGGRMDTDNPVNRSYLDRKQSAVKAAASFAPELSPQYIKAIQPAVPKPAENSLPTEDAPAKAMLNMTLREIVLKYQSMEGVERYVKLLRDLTATDEKQQRLQERRQLQIPKDFVVARLFGFINQLTNKVLDVPESLADQVIALVQSDPDNCRQKIVNYSRDVLSRAIGGAKETVINELQSLRSKYDDQENISEKIEELYEQQMQ